LEYGLVIALIVKIMSKEYLYICSSDFQFYYFGFFLCVFMVGIKFEERIVSIMLTPAYAVVELEGCCCIKDAGGQAGVEVHPLDEHPEDGGQVAEHQAPQHQPAHPRLRKGKAYQI
jgi:hypothetical protein